MTRAQMIDQRIRSIAQDERDALAKLTKELREMESIRGYIELGFKSLYAYLTVGVGYSSGAAQRRIDAARLSKDVPSLGEKLQSGTIDLHHITSVSKAVRQASKDRPVTVEEKREIVEQIQSEREAKTQQVVAEFFDLEVITSTKKSVQKDGSVRYEITLSREDAEKIEKAQALVSHAVPTNNIADYLVYTAERIIKQKTQPARERKKKSVDSTATMAVNADAPESTATMAVKTDAPVPDRLHREVRSEQPNCVECGSAWFPQTDHRRSRWADGTNERENLQTLCGPCNRAKYRREAGLR